MMNSNFIPYKFLVYPGFEIPALICIVLLDNIYYLKEQYK